MDLLVSISFDATECSRNDGVFEVLDIALQPEIYPSQDFDYALGVYDHPQAFETFFTLYDPLELIPVQFHYFDHSHDAPQQNYLTYEHLAALSRHSLPQVNIPDLVSIDLEKVWLLDLPNTYYFKVPCLYDNKHNKKTDVPNLYQGCYATLKEVLKAVNLAMGNPTPMVELLIENFEERTAYWELFKITINHINKSYFKISQTSTLPYN